jgi:glycosyltransferase involved in cell wall biosynthesis
MNRQLLASLNLKSSPSFVFLFHQRRYTAVSINKFIIWDIVKLSIVIPIYNEKETIDGIIRRVEAVPLPGIEKEIILVDDHSTDGTADRLRAWEGKYRVLYHPQNRGKGAALRTGFQHATGDTVIVQDADLELNPGEYPQLLAPLLADKADVVFGSRFLGKNSHLDMRFRSYLANKFLTFLSNLFSNLKLTDMETGCKVFRKSVLDSVDLVQDRFGFEPEVTAKIARLPGLRLCEVKISYECRNRKEGKKISWKDGMGAIWCIVRYNLFL